jgi:hypothetical protein
MLAVVELKLFLDSLQPDICLLNRMVQSSDSINAKRTSYTALTDQDLV